MRRRALWAGVALGLSGASCGPAESEARFAAGGIFRAVVGPDGGALAFRGGRLEVPAGALAAPVTLAAEVLPDGSVALYPEGLRFLRAATLYLPLPPAGVGEPYIVKAVGRLFGGSAEGSPAVEVFDTQVAGDELRARIWGFSFYLTQRFRGLGSISKGPISAAARLTELDAKWDACAREVALSWAEASPVYIHRYLSSDGQAGHRYFALPAASSGRAVHAVDAGFPKLAGGDHIQYDYAVPVPGWPNVIYRVGQRRVSAQELAVPGAPNRFRARREGPGRMILSWQASLPSSQAFAGFALSRQPSFPGPVEVVGHRFEDVSVQAGQAYQYSIRAFYEPVGCPRRLYGPSVTTAGAASSVGPSLALSGLRADRRGTSVGLQWDPTVDAAGYRVRRALLSGGLSAVLGETNALAFEDVPVPSGTWRYSVAPLGADGGEGQAASVVIDMVDCSTVGPPELSILADGGPARFEEFYFVVSAEMPVVDLVITGTTAGSNSEWAEQSIDGGWQRIGSMPRVRHTLDCPPARGFCRLRGTIRDSCGDRTSELLYVLD